MKVRGFKGLRFSNDNVKQFSSKPYDVVTKEEIKEKVTLGEDLFYYVIRGDAFYNENIHQREKENFNKLKKDGILKKENSKAFYIYKEITENAVNRGLFLTVSVDDYINNKIKIHEKTIREKEINRENHFLELRADTEPVFFFQDENSEIDLIMKKFETDEKKIIDFTDEDNIRHIVYIIDSLKYVENLEKLFSKVENFYIADGHHRTKSMVNTCLKIRSDEIEKNGEYEKNALYNYLMAVVFFKRDLKIYPYNRIIKNPLGKFSKDYVLEKLKENFEIKKENKLEFPKEKHEFEMILQGEIYNLKLKEKSINSDVVENLDVSILDNLVVKEIFKIDNIKDLSKIDFFALDNKKIKNDFNKFIERKEEGGIFKNNSILFLVKETSLDEIVKVSDLGLTMPQKSTYFYPKLRSGLLVYEF